MTEQQPVEATPATPTEESQEPAPTAEQVEAEYKARLSGKDKAHAAETKTLRDRIAELEGGRQAAQAAQAGSEQDADALRAQLDQERKAFQQEREQHTAELRSTKYPFAAEALDPQVLASMDEAKLAGLEARLTPSRTPVGMDPSTPPRNAVAPKPVEEKTSAELREDLRAMSGQLAAELRGNT